VKRYALVGRLAAQQNDETLDGAAMKLRTYPMSATRRAVGLAAVLLSTAAGVQADQSPELLWELGGPNAPEYAAWTRITDAQLLGDAVFVTDPVIGEVRSFGVDGEYRTNLGREGQGPGEFLIPISLQVWADTLAIYDLGQRRWALFDQAGVHLRTTTWGRPDGVNLQWARRLSGGRFIGWTAWVNRRGVEYPHALLTWTDSSRVDTLRTFTTGNLRYRSRDDGNLNSSTVTVGQGGGVSFIGDSLVMVLDGFEPSLSVYLSSRSGLRLLSSQRLPGNAEEVTAAERHQIEGYLADRYGRLSEVRIPDRIPAWTDVQAVGETLWIRGRRQTKWRGDAREAWARLTPAGRVERTVQFPPGVHVLRIVEGYAIAVRHDELDIPYLQLYRFP
jgi:hypothetical protein